MMLYFSILGPIGCIFGMSSLGNLDLKRTFMIYFSLDQLYMTKKDPKADQKNDIEENDD